MGRYHLSRGHEHVTDNIVGVNANSCHFLMGIFSQSSVLVAVSLMVPCVNLMSFLHENLWLCFHSIKADPIHLVLEVETQGSQTNAKPSALEESNL